VGDEAQRVHPVAVEQQVHLHQIAGAVAGQLIVQRGVALGVGLQRVEKVVDDLVQRHLIVQLHQMGVQILHVLELAAPLLAHGHDVPHKVLRRDDGHLDVRLLRVLDGARIGVVVGVVHLHHGAVGLVDVVDDAGQRGHQVQVEFPLQPLLNDLHVQHAQKAAAEAEAQRCGGFRLKRQRRIVELQLFQRIPQIGVLAAVLGVDAAVHHGLGGAVARQRLRGGGRGVGDGVAHAGIFNVLDAGGEIAYLAGLQAVRGLVAQRLEIAALQNGVLRAAGHHANGLALADGTLHDAEQHHHAHVGVVLAVEYQRPQRRLGVALGGGHVLHHVLQYGVDVDAQLGGDLRGLQRGQADDVLHLLLGLQGVGGGQVDLVEHRQDLQIVVHGKIRVGQRLGLHALGGIHHQQRALAGGQRPADLVIEVHVARGVDEVQGVGFSVLRLIEDLDGAGLDGNAPLPLQIHIVQQLVLHLPLRHGVALLQQAIRQRGFAVVDVGNNGKVADMGLVKHSRKPPLEIHAARVERVQAFCGAKPCRRRNLFPPRMSKLFSPLRRQVVHIVDHLRRALPHAGGGGERIGVQHRHLFRLSQRPQVYRAAAQHSGVHRARIEVHAVHGEEILVAAAPPVVVPQQGIQRRTEIVAGGGDGRPVAALAQQVEQHAGGVHHQLFLQGGQDTALQRSLFVAGVIQLRRLDDGPVAGAGAPQQKVRRHVIEVAGPGHEGQSGLADAIFVVAQQRLTDAQCRSGLPLADAHLLPQQAQRSGKIRCQFSHPVYFYTARKSYPI
jgi:hypothetical protein